MLLKTSDDLLTILGATAATPVAFPLPSNFIVADALSPFEPPNPENGGVIKSKYTVPPEALAANIRDSSIWDEAFAKDPAFTELVNPAVKPITFMRRESRRSPERERQSFYEHRKPSAAEHGSRHDVRSHSFKNHHPLDDRRRWSRDRSRSPPRFDRSVHNEQSVLAVQSTNYLIFPDVEIISLVLAHFREMIVEGLPS